MACIESLPPPRVSVLYFESEWVGRGDLQISSCAQIYDCVIPYLEHMGNLNDENLNEAHQNLENTISFYARVSNVGEYVTFS